MANEDIKKMTNLDLMEETLGLAGGDDYDGCFTPEGSVRFSALKQELSARLWDVGFIDESIR